MLSDKELSIVWAFGRRKRHCPHFEATELGNRIARAMRRHFPLPGTHWDKFLTVYLKPGQHIAAHFHKRHAVLWYPEATSVITEQLPTERKPIELAAGEMIYLPPFMLHEVPRVTVERLSVAMLVSEPATARLIPIK